MPSHLYDISRAGGPGVFLMDLQSIIIDLGILALATTLARTTMQVTLRYHVFCSSQKSYL